MPATTPPSHEPCSPASGVEHHPLLQTGLIVLVTAVLWLAAAGKAAQVVTEPMLPDRWFWTAVAETELLLGLALLLGRRSRKVWVLIGCIFLGLAVFAGVKALRGEPDCGCFGVVPVNPWVTMALDLVLAGLLLTQRPSAPPTNPEPDENARLIGSPAKAGIALTLVSGAVLALTVAATPPGELRTDGEIEGQGGHVVLNPEAWVGHPFPLSAYLPDTTGFGYGSWEIALIRPGCPHCTDFLRQWKPEGSTRSVAAVSLGAPFDDLRHARPDLSTYVVSQDRRWYAEVPLVIQLEEGVVTKVHSPLGSNTRLLTDAGQTGNTPVDPAGTETLQDAVWFDAAGRIRLGYTRPGSTKTLALRLQAPPDAPLEIRRIYSECKCTTITQAPDRIEAGGEGMIVMRFTASDKPLDYNQGVLIQTDHPDPGKRNQRLVVTARIGLPLSVDPPEVGVDRGSGVASNPLLVAVTNDGPDPIRLIYAVAESPGVTAQVPRDPIAPGQSVEVPIIIQPDRWDGRDTRLRIPTTCPEQPDLFITIEAAGS